MLALNTPCPNFNLRDVMHDQKLSRDDCKGAKALLVMFICNHCPYVQHVLSEFRRLADNYIPLGVKIVAINSNDVQAYPDDSPPRMRELGLKEGWTFPFLFDETQTVAKAFYAACTPDFYLFDQDLKLVYRGQLDDSRPGNNKPVTGKDLRAAIDATISGRPVSSDQKPSVGCNIKWKPNTCACR